MSGCRARVLLGALCCALVLAACSACGSSSNSTSPPPGPDDAIQVSGREHFGWDQSADDIGSYHFAVYDNNNRVELPGTVCHASASNSFVCDSQLPPLTPGRHTLEVVAYVVADGQMVESARAAPLVVNMTGLTPSSQLAPPALPAPAAPSSTPAAVGCGLAPVSAQEFVFWDNSGTIHAIDRSSGVSRGVEWKRAESEVWKLAGLTAHPRFAENRWIYLVELAATGDAGLRLSRYREVANVLGERAVLLQIPLESAPSRTSASFGPDGYLSIGLLSSGEGQTQIGTNRFLLRLTDAGTPAPGNLNGSPFANVSGSAPVALARDTDGGAPWLLTPLPDHGYALTRLGEPTSGGNRLIQRPLRSPCKSP